MQQVILIVIVSMWIGGHLGIKAHEGADFIGFLLTVLYVLTFLWLLTKGFIAVLG